MGKYSDMLSDAGPASGAGKYSKMAEAFEAERPAVDPNKQRGRNFPSGAAGGMTALQGPLFGFADELAGAMNAWGRALNNDFDLKGNYLAGRDMYRGAVDSARERNPGTMAVTSAMASAPLIALSGGSAAPANALTRFPVANRIVQAAIPAAIYGGATGAGESKASDVPGVLLDTAKGAATSAAIAGASQPILMGMGSAGRAAMSRMSQSSADDYAQQKVAEALARDARGTVAQGSVPKALTQAEARLRSLGDDAAVVDAGGQNTRGLLDVVATAPGRTKDATERFIRARQAGRAGRIAAAADDALGTQGRGFMESIESFDAARRQAAAPLYAQLDDVMVQVDDDLASLLNRSAGYHGEADKLARISGISGEALSSVKPGQAVPLRMLDTLKQSLYDAADSAKASGNRKMGAAIDGLRTSLVSKLDDVSPKDQAGQSIYKLARDAWGGPSSSISAAEAGRRAMREDVVSLAEMTNGMSASELEAFRIGAAQALREQAGTQAGQTRLLKMWMEPATSNKLRAIFGENYRQFAASIAKEARKKGAESVGRGSQTAARLMGADDLDVSAVQDAAGAAANVARGNLGGALPSLMGFVNRMQTPEPVRDRMGQILLSQGQQGRNSLVALRDMAEAVEQERMRRAAMAGAFSGVLRLEQ